MLCDGSAFTRDTQRGLETSLSLGVDACGRSVETGDIDALNYIRTVQLADNQTLEPLVVASISTLFKGLKETPSLVAGVSNWAALQTLVLLAGPRTLAGIAVRAKGSTPTLTNFVASDYLRKKGLKGNTTTKSITTAWNNSTPGGSTSTGAIGAYLTEPPSLGRRSALISGGAHSTTIGEYSDRCAIIIEADGSVRPNMWHPVIAPIADSVRYGLYHAAKDGVSWENRVSVGGVVSTYNSNTNGKTAGNVFACCSSNAGGYAVDPYGDQRMALYYCGIRPDPVALNVMFSNFLAELDRAIP